VKQVPKRDPADRSIEIPVLQCTLQTNTDHLALYSTAIHHIYITVQYSSGTRRVISTSVSKTVRRSDRIRSESGAKVGNVDSASIRYGYSGSQIAKRGVRTN